MASRTSAKGRNCSARCLTKDHKTFGECIRAKGVQLSPHVNDTYNVRQNALDKELDHYESAVRQGVEPDSTKKKDVDAALKAAESGN